MVRNVKGFSFVEVMISMVILSIVALIMSGVITTSSKMSRGAQGTDDGRALAKEKLIGLQDVGDVAIPGNDSPQRGGITYARDWTIGVTKPYKCSVTVAWTLDGVSKNVNIVGYIHGNVCASITNNTPPDSLIFNDKNSVELIGTDKNEITLPKGTGATSEDIVLLTAVDADLTNGDVVTATLAPYVNGTNNNDKFLINNNVLYTNYTFATGNTDYIVQILGTDCANTSLTKAKNVKVHISDNSVPTITFSSTTGSIDEDFTGQITTLSIVGADQPVVVTPIANDGRSVLGSFIYNDVNSNNTNAQLETTANDYETGSRNISIEVKATNSFGEIKDTFTAIINDVNEAPTDITLDNNSITGPTVGGEVIGTLSVVDQDASGNSNGLVASYNSVQNDKFTVEVSGTDTLLKVVSSTVLASGDYDVKVTSTDDNGGNPLVFEKTFTITITASGGGGTIDCSSDSAFVVWDGGNSVTYYGGASGQSISKVTYGGKEYKGASIQNTWYNYTGKPDALSYWEEVGVCQ